MAAEEPFWSQECEMSVLGSMLLSDTVAYELSALIDPSEFYSPAHRLIFESMRALIRADKRFDYLILKEHLQTRGVLQDAGGEDFILQIADMVPTYTNARFYAEIMQEHAAIRRVRVPFAKLGSMFRTGELTLECVRQMISEMLEQSIGSVASSVDLGSIRISETEGTGFTTSFPEFDKLTHGHGHPRAHYTIYMADSGGGKTTVMLSEATNLLTQGHHIAWVTFADLTAEEIKGRVMRMRTGYSKAPRKLDNERADWLEIMENWGTWFGDCTMIDAYKSRMPLESVLAKLEAVHAKKPLMTVFLDYGQKMTLAKGTGSSVGDQERAADLCQGFVRNTMIPTAIGSQVTEDPKLGRTTKGARRWFENAGVVLDLELDEEFGLCNILVRKNRIGPHGTKKDPLKIVLTFDNKKHIRVESQLEKL